MTTPANPGTEKLIALLTNGSQFAGPAALLSLKHLNCRVYVHDQSFSDDAKLKAFASAHDGVIPLAGNRLSVANDVIRAEGRLDILIENPSPRGEAHVTDDDNVEGRQWRTRVCRRVTEDAVRATRTVSRRHVQARVAAAPHVRKLREGLSTRAGPYSRPGKQVRAD
jgi:hypothetical protein